MGGGIAGLSEFSRYFIQLQQELLCGDGTGKVIRSRILEKGELLCTKHCCIWMRPIKASVTGFKGE
jgi:hypothetical protein